MCLPAAARYFLSGVMHSLFTCDSGCWIVREQIPDSASQNLCYEDRQLDIGGSIEDSSAPDCVVITS